MSTNVVLFDTREQALERQVLTERATAAEALAKEANVARAEVVRLLKREDAGWLEIFGGQPKDGGFTLDDLKKWSPQIQEAIKLNPLIGRGVRLRGSYIWQDGIQYRRGTIPGDTRSRKDGPKVVDYIDDPLNQRNFFGAAARKIREKSLYSDGIYLRKGHDRTKILTSIPLRQVGAIHVDPENEADIWAYRQDTRVTQSDGTTTDKKVWYFVDTFISKRTDKIMVEGEAQDVSQDHTLFDFHANGTEGVALGVPDALAALVWSRIVRDLTMDGVKMSEAMATFAFKAAVTSKNGADNASIALGGSAAAGSTAVVGSPNGLVPLATAGKGYDFSSYRAVTANVATALDVSTTALTSDTGDGGAYGSEQTLDLPTRLAMESRRDEHVAYDTRVLKWMGAEAPEVYFETLDDAADIFRLIQAAILKQGTGLYSAEETKFALEGHTENIPKGYLIPNNEATLKTTSAATATPDTTEPSAASPGQGKSTGAAGVKGNDLRDDKVGEALAPVFAKLSPAERKSLERLLGKAGL